MRNTNHKLFHDKSLRHIHNDLNIIGAVRNYFIALSMRYYRRYGKGLSYSKMSRHLTKLRNLEKYQHWHIRYLWSLQNMFKRLVQSFREMRTLGRGHPQFKSCQKHKGMAFDGTQTRLEKVLDKQKHHRNHPTYRIRLNGRSYRFALHRPIKALSLKFMSVETPSETCISPLLQIFRKSSLNPRQVKLKRLISVSQIS